MSIVETLHLDLGNRGYDILVGSDLLSRTGELAHPLLAQERMVVITDENVAPIYLDRVCASIEKAGIRCDRIILPAGEQTKSFKYLEDLLDQLLELKVERRTTLAALGGGVIGDLVGLAAAIILRGIDFIQIPTTLLSQVDSSVGGKTAIDTVHGKNLVGAFHQPRLVIADVDTLDSLPANEMRAGYAEVVKYGLINDAEFFSWLESNGAALCEGDKEARRRAVLKSCAAKSAIVSRDEREDGVRALLNLGHTFAHALEVEVGYSGDLLHGEAVAIGIVMAFDLSAKIGLCSNDDAARVRAHFKSIGLRTDPSDIQNIEWTTDRLLQNMSQDKKVRDGSINFILARGIGEAFITNEVSDADIRAVLDRATGA